jgi:predicted TIM-barrel fold metal-dependent hydrolase
MHPYFVRTDLDEAFYAEHIRERLPRRIFDIHVHLNLPEHVRQVPEERWLSDWALESGHLLPVEDAYTCAAELFPQTEYRIAGFPWPIREADLQANNHYLARARQKGLVTPFMTVRPEWDLQWIEQTLIGDSFVGFKPYPDMVSGLKGAEMSIFDFLPHEQWALLDKHRKAVMLHLPRRERLADRNNIRELLEARQRYPQVNIIIAHFGRSFCPYYLKEGLDLLSDPELFFFDTTAVINPEVYDLAFSEIPIDRILFGSDMPILFWHGRRSWTQKEYHNFCREPFSWVTEHEAPEVENRYTLFLYEQMKNILDAMDRHRFTARDKEALFYTNTADLLAASQPSNPVV